MIKGGELGGLVPIHQDMTFHGVCKQNIRLLLADVNRMNATLLELWLEYSMEVGPVIECSHHLP